VIADADLYARGSETVLGSWEAIARGSPGAAVLRRSGVAAAVFPAEPERSVYNNALLERGLGARDRAQAIDAMASAYAAAGVTRYAAWAHESDPALRADLEARGYTIDTTTRAMGMALDDIRMPRPELELARPDWDAYLRFLVAVGVPEGLLRGVDPTAFRLVLASRDGTTVATALAFDLQGDCGIYNVSTLAAARRRGLGTAVTALCLHEARASGCRTASLQSTKVAEGMYLAVGFRDLGRIIEYTP
jgi:ribosomal protein S18 acetylase RimI-like enzyme